MKEIKFKTFEQFCNAKLKLQDGEEILYYSRFFGNRDWGYCITGFFNRDFEKCGEKTDYMQVQFFTHDIQFATTGEVIANPDGKVMTLKGITDENYNIVCNWIEEQRSVLFESITELKGEVNPLIDLAIQEEILEQKVISND